MSFFKDGELRLLWPFYLARFISASFFFVMFFWVIYFNQVGLSYKQISFLFFLFFTAPLFFEIPTGAFADAYGRKFSVILGNFGVSLSLFLIPFAKSYFAILFLLLCWGIFTAFISGAVVLPAALFYYLAKGQSS